MLLEANLETPETIASKFYPEHVKTKFSSVEKWQSRHLVHFCVSDCGIGVPKNKRKLIFESFAQGEGSTTTKLCRFMTSLSSHILSPIPYTEVRLCLFFSFLDVCSWWHWLGSRHISSTESTTRRMHLVEAQREPRIQCRSCK